MNGFIHSLLASGPAADRAPAMDTYGWLVGDWLFDAQITADDGSTTRIGNGEIHAAWVLDGRAIQDVWTLPGVFVGSTLRVYDPGLQAWHIVWSDPLRQYYNRQLGRRLGDRIVQEGTDGAGDATRWSFVEIGTDRFRWLGERRAGTQEPWRQVADFAARRITSTTSIEEPAMIEHLSLGVRDLAASRRFYDAALAPLGYRCLSHDDGSLGYGRASAALWLLGTGHPVAADPRSGLHVCLQASDRAGVDAFHAAALAHGGHDNGAPGLRPDYGADYYAAFVTDPDGYRIEAHVG